MPGTRNQVNLPKKVSLRGTKRRSNPGKIIENTLFLDSHNPLGFAMTILYKYKNPKPDSLNRAPVCHPGLCAGIEKRVYRYPAWQAMTGFRNIILPETGNLAPEIVSRETIIKF